MPDLPDIQGFKDAMDRGREALGQDVEFSIPVAPVYPPGTQLDPESDEPYDPTVVPTSGGGETTVTIRVGVISRPVTTRAVDDVTTGPLGIMSNQDCALDVKPSDYTAIEDATSFVVDSTTYTVTDRISHGLGEVDRWIIFGEAQ